MKGLKPRDSPFSLDRILSGLDPMRDSWRIGTPCEYGHGDEYGENIRYIKGDSCVMCNTEKARLRKLGKPQKKGKPRSIRIDSDYVDSKEWDCYMADRWLQKWKPTGVEL